MTMRRHCAWLALLFLLSGALLAACQAPTPSNETGPATSEGAGGEVASDDPRDAGQAQPGAAGPAGEARVAARVTGPRLLLATTEDGRGLEFMQKVAQEFGAARGWTIQVVQKPSDLLRVDFETAALAEQGPDLVWAGSEEVGSVAAAGLIQPVDTFFNPADYFPASVAAARLNGAQWGVPLTAGNHLLLLYNKKLIARPPGTTAELLSLPRPAGADVTLDFRQSDPLWLAPWLGGYGGRLFSDDNRPTLNTPEMISALTLLKELREKDIIPPTGDFAASEALFKAGKVAMIIDGDWSIAAHTSAAAESQNLELGIAPLPAISATNRPATPFVSGTYLMVAKSVSDQKLDAARAFISYVTGPAVQARVATELRRLPARSDVLASETVQSDPELKPLAEALANGTAKPAQAELRMMWEVMRPFIAAVLSGEQEPQAAAEAMQGAVESAMGGGQGQ